MLSASRIHSATLMWKYDVASRDTPNSWFVPSFIICNILGDEVPSGEHYHNNYDYNNNNNSILFVENSLEWTSSSCLTVSRTKHLNLRTIWRYTNKFTHLLTSIPTQMIAPPPRTFAPTRKFRCRVYFPNYIYDYV
jgi:hypothetical protein